MDRHYLRCTYCERPMSVEVSEREELKVILEQACPLCGEKALRYMGQVQKTNIVRASVKAACDARCTNAVGPKCDCVCVNVNHGTKKLIVFNKVVGKLEVVEKDLLNNNEVYLARIKRMAAAKNFIKVNVITFLNWKNKEVLALAKSLGGYWKLGWEDYNKYQTYGQMLKKIDKLEDLKSIQRKINSLTKMIPQIGSNLEYLESLYEKKTQQNQEKEILHSS